MSDYEEKSAQLRARGDALHAQLRDWPPNPHPGTTDQWGRWRCPTIRYGLRGGPGLTLGCEAAITDFAQQICRSRNLDTGECEKLRDTLLSGAVGDELAALLAQFPQLDGILPDLLAAVADGALNYGTRWPAAPVTEPTEIIPAGAAKLSSAYLSGNSADASGSMTGAALIGPGFVTAIAWGFANPYGFTSGTLDLDVIGVVHLASLHGSLAAWRSNSLQLGRGIYLPPGATAAARIQSRWVGAGVNPYEAQVVAAFQPTKS